MWSIWFWNNGNVVIFQQRYGYFLAKLGIIAIFAQLMRIAEGRAA